MLRPSVESWLRLIFWWIFVPKLAYMGFSLKFSWILWPENRFWGLLVLTHDQQLQPISCVFKKNSVTGYKDLILFPISLVLSKCFWERYFLKFYSRKFSYRLFWPLIHFSNNTTFYLHQWQLNIWTKVPMTWTQLKLAKI